MPQPERKGLQLTLFLSKAKFGKTTFDLVEKGPLLL